MHNFTNKKVSIMQIVIVMISAYYDKYKNKIIFKKYFVGIKTKVTKKYLVSIKTKVLRIENSRHRYVFSLAR